MLDVFLILLAIGLGGDKAGQAPETAEAQAPAPGGGASMQAGQGGDPSGAAEAPKYQAESQVPTGRFTTATEVRPILEMTRANWVAVREYDGQDLVYLTHLLSWRCGLVAIEVSLNGGALEEWPMEPCHEDSNAPNALIDDPTSIYRSYPLGFVETIKIEITYDDLTADTATFDRKGAMIP
ncbi:hypothetical protein [Tropicibacter oceani]|uniref:Uncharacterized protein n=1 Tax=Tropicibacter oceani TaxID=3058420 RepID=A0ABY8QE08_9RHOB|nr:hypothetical protein [Tropicibacter oceani]WGW02238.1 hypothetical protein QF118_09710 [Tropicibacter oceani]